MTFLGHVVSNHGVEVDPKKIEVVKNRQRPLTPTDNQNFLGLANYYRRFVEGFFYYFCPIDNFNKEEGEV